MLCWFGPLQVSSLVLTATLDTLSIQSSTPPPSCLNATCYFATPVWVPGNSSNPDESTLYVPTFPTFPIQPACPDKSVDSGAGTGDNSQPIGALSLDGLSVAVAPATVPGVAMNGASLVFSGADPFNTTLRLWNASSDEVDTAVRWVIPGFNPSVTRER